MKAQKPKLNEPNYDCVICFELCKKPVSCLRCHQLLCHHHLRLIGNKCPHCRLQPFRFSQQPMINSYIQIQVRKIREAQKKDKIFKCLVSGCNFQGKYPSMEFHRKSRHYYEKIDDIIYPEDRQKKLMRDAIKKIFLNKYVDQVKKYSDQALMIYIKSKGIVEMKELIKMVSHIDKCPNECCKQVIIGQMEVGVGYKIDQMHMLSPCLKALQFTTKI